ncbi:MAG: hypothetical protein ACQEXV_13070 [Bacillota bacterium]
MVVYTLRRLIQMIPALLGIVVITFMILRVLPGDPAVMLGVSLLRQWAGLAVTSILPHTLRDFMYSIPLAPF